MNIPIPLLDDIAAGKCLPFIGAGFSLNAKLPEKYEMPDWPVLTTILSKAVKLKKKILNIKLKKKDIKQLESYSQS